MRKEKGPPTLHVRGRPLEPTGVLSGGRGSPVHGNKLGRVQLVPEVEKEILAAISTAMLRQSRGGQPARRPVSSCPAVLQLPTGPRPVLAGFTN